MRISLKSLFIALGILIPCTSSMAYNGIIGKGDVYKYPNITYRVWQLQECVTDTPVSFSEDYSLETLEKWNCSTRDAVRLSLNATNVMMTIIGTCANPTPKGVVLSMGFSAAINQVIGMFVDVVPCDDFNNDLKQAENICRVISEMTKKPCDPKKIIVKRSTP